MRVAVRGRENWVVGDEKREAPRARNDLALLLGMAASIAVPGGVLAVMSSRASSVDDIENVGIVLGYVMLVYAVAVAASAYLATTLLLRLWREQRPHRWLVLVVAGHIAVVGVGLLGMFAFVGY